MDSELIGRNKRRLVDTSDGFGVYREPSKAFEEAYGVIDRMSDHMKQIRESKGVSVAQLAKWVDISYGAIRNIESGKTRPRLDTVIWMACAMGVSLDEYVGMPQKQSEPERPVGYWIMHDDEILGLSCECSVCHIETVGDSPYCPRCGSKLSPTTTTK